MVVVGEVVVVVVVVGGGEEASCGLPTPPPTIGSRGGSRILHIGLPVIYACLRAVWNMAQGIDRDISARGFHFILQ